MTKLMIISDRKKRMSVYFYNKNNNKLCLKCISIMLYIIMCIIILCYNAILSRLKRYHVFFWTNFTQRFVVTVFNTLRPFFS